MSQNRREFLKNVAAGGAAAVAAGATVAAPEPAQALQREPLALAPDAVGLLYDSTLCVGCKACVKACKEANGMPPEIEPELSGWNARTWDTPEDLSGKTLNIIKVYQNGTMAQKDRETDGYAFIKRQCLHCLDPSCVSVCPVSAMTKDAKTGIVSHHPDKCIGCRYCVYSCPFGVPRYEFDQAFGRIRKCELCQHRLAKGDLPGCVDACPTGATLFGRTADLKKEGARRLAMKPGETQHYPRGDLNKKYGGDRPGHEKVVEAAYQPRVYGEQELGGVQCLYLSAVPISKLGLPENVPDYGYPTISEGIQESLYNKMIAPIVVLGGLVFMAYRNARPDEGDES